MGQNEIYQNFYPTIVKFLKNKTNCNEDAQDLAQEVFYKVFKDDHNYTEIENLGGWIFKVANNTLIDYYRKKKPINTEISEASLPKSSQLEDKELQFAEWIEQEVKCCFHYFLSELDPETQHILRAVEIDNKSQKLLAEEMNLPYVTLRSKVQRGRKKIKARFLELCDMTFDKYGQVLDCKAKECTPNCVANC